MRDGESKGHNLIDMTIFRFLCGLRPNDFRMVGTKLLKCESVVPMESMKINYMGMTINLKYCYGNWYTSLKAKGMTPQGKVFNSLLRDLEGALIVDCINANNSLHDPLILLN